MSPYHPSDTDYYFVKHCREEGLKLVEWIRQLVPLLPVKWSQNSEIYAHLWEIKAVLSADPKLKLVDLSEFGHYNGPSGQCLDQMDKLRRAARTYHPLHERLVREMCRLCKLSERVPGKFLDRHQVKWWKEHQKSRGHET